MNEKDHKFLRDQRDFLLRHPAVRRKQYPLWTTDHQLVEMGIALRECGLYSLRHFLVGMMILFLENDPNVLKAVDDLKDRYKVKYRKNTLQTSTGKRREEIEKRIFDLTDEELEELYSLVEIDQEF